MTLRKRVDDIKRIKMHSDIIAGEYAIKLVDDLISLLDRAMQGLELASKHNIGFQAVPREIYNNCGQTLTEIRSKLDGDGDGK